MCIIHSRSIPRDRQHNSDFFFPLIISKHISAQKTQTTCICKHFFTFASGLFIPKPVSNCRQTPGRQNFLINNFIPYLTFSRNMRTQIVSLNTFFLIWISALQWIFFLSFFLTSYSQNISLNIVWNLIPLHMVPISNWFYLCELSEIYYILCSC